MPTASEILLAHFHGQGRLRVWSLIVTILGDIVEPSGGQIEMTDLVAMCATLGIEEQAVRTAVSRLAKEGWISGERTGRTASYRFSSEGRQRFLKAADAIYAAPKPAPVKWVLGVLPTETAARRDVLSLLEPTVPLVLNNQLAVWSHAQKAEVEALVAGQLSLFTSETLSLRAYKADEIAPILPLDDCQAIHSALTDLDMNKTTPAAAITTRILLIHFWRRILLRYPAVHAPLDAENWPLPDIQKQVAAHYQSIAACGGYQVDKKGFI